jgi:hypothetical protein
MSAMTADAARGDGRTEAREPTRVRPREPHERFSIDENRLDPSRDYQWVSLACRGETNPQLNDFFAAGWEPERAANFPRNSGINVAVSERLIALGHMKEVNPDDPIIDRNLMLCSRPKTLSAQSRKEDSRMAEGQVDNHMGRLRSMSRRAIGDKTQISRRMTRSPSSPDGMIPDDADVEI